MKVKRYQKDFDYSYTLGISTTIELLSSRPDEVLEVIVHSRITKKGVKNDGLNRIASLCKTYNIQVRESDKNIEKLSVKENCYCVGIFRKYKTKIDSSKNHLVLVGARDMGNIGTIARTMLGFGIHDLVLIRPAADVFDPKVSRASVGAIFSINFDYFETFRDHQEHHPQRSTYCFMLHEQSNNIYSIDFKNQKKYPTSLVFGSESHGLAGEFLNYGTPVQIKHSPEIDSLNLSVSVGIGLFWFSKQLF